MKFRVDFGAKDEGRLSPFEDDKPKDPEITLFKAGSDNYCHAMERQNFTKIIKQ